MMRFPSFFKKETPVAFLLIAIIISVSLLPDISKWQHTPIGHVYQPIHNNLIDYAVYINFIKQGLDGNTKLINRFTTEPHVGTVPSFFFLGLGLLGKAVGITDPNLMYHVSRVGLGILFALTSYWFIRRYVKGKAERLIALFLILFSGSFPIIKWSNNAFTVSTYLSWWSGIDPVIRATFLPHHLAGHILMLITIFLITQIASTNDRFVKVKSFRGDIPFLLSIRQLADQSRRSYTRSNSDSEGYNGKRILLAAGTGFLAGLFHPPSLVLPLLILPIWLILTKQWKTLIICMLFLPLWGLSICLLTWQFTVFPWTDIRAYERLMFAIPVWEYCLALGPILPLAAGGAIIKRKQPLTLLWMLWIIIPILSIPVSRLVSESSIPYFRLFTISNVRLLQMAIVVPSAILSAASLMWVFHRFGKITGSVLLILFISLTILPYPYTIIKQSTHLFGGLDYQYPTIGWMKAVGSLAGGNGAVLSLPFAGCTITATSNRTVYVGREVYTINLGQKTDLAFQFYQGTMPLCQAYNLLSDARITDIFYGYDEKTAGGDFTRYPFLQLKKDFKDTQIFSFSEKKPMECP